MITIGLADAFDDDPCNPASPNYDPSPTGVDLCQQFASAGLAPGSSTPTAPEIEMDPGSATLRQSCPSGYILIGGTCMSTVHPNAPTINPTTVAMPGGAASLVGSVSSWWWLAALAAAGIGGWFLYGKRLSEQNRQGKLSGHRRR